MGDEQARRDEARDIVREAKADGTYDQLAHAAARPSIGEMVLVIAPDQRAYLEWCHAAGRNPNGGPTRRVNTETAMFGPRWQDTAVVIVGYPKWWSDDTRAHVAGRIKQLIALGATVREEDVDGNPR